MNAQRCGWAAIAATALACLGWLVTARASLTEHKAASRERLHAETPQLETAEGYTTSSACRACHPAAYHSWHQSYHRTMTQRADEHSVLGDFDDVHLDYFGQTFQLQKRGSEYWVQMHDQWRQVVQTTGSHHYQMYWLAGDEGNLLENLPFAYLIAEDKWVRRNDIFMLPPELAAQPEAHHTWNNSCISCHATHGQPGITEEQPAPRTRVAELGIACEACHGPADEHLRKHSNPLARYSRRLGIEQKPSLVNPADLSHQLSSQVCGQCHGISAPHDPEQWLQTGSAFRPGTDLQEERHVLRHPARAQTAANQGLTHDFLNKYFWPDGMVRVSGREYNGLVESACHQRGELSCLSCHSMHDSDPNDQLAAHAQHNDACLTCHTDVGADITAHTHHDAGSSGSQCYNCHMPHTTYGLVKAIRSHEIDSPNVATTLATGRPNACNLCHLDRTLDWTGDHLTAWYGQERTPIPREHSRVAAAVHGLIAGDAGERAITAWHLAWQPAQDAAGDDWLAPFVAQLLVDDYAVVRSLAGRALKHLPGIDGIDYDYTKGTDHWQAVADTVRNTWKTQSVEAPLERRDAILLSPEGEIDYGRLFDLRARRNLRPVDLLE